MKEQFKKILGNAAAVWGKLSVLQKIIGIAVILVVLTGVVLLSVYSSSPGLVRVLTNPVTDENLLNKISLRIDEEGISHQITPEGIIYVDDERTAQRIVSLLAREDLIPSEASPWDIFKMDRWTVTDFERNVNLRRAVTESLKNHLEALDDIDSAQVSLVLPEDELFQEDQNKFPLQLYLLQNPVQIYVKTVRKLKVLLSLLNLQLKVWMMNL